MSVRVSSVKECVCLCVCVCWFLHDLFRRNARVYRLTARAHTCKNQWGRHWTTRLGWLGRGRLRRWREIDTLMKHAQGARRRFTKGTHRYVNVVDVMRELEPIPKKGSLKMWCFSHTNTHRNESKVGDWLKLALCGRDIVFFCAGVSGGQ